MVGAELNHSVTMKEQSLNTQCTSRSAGKPVTVPSYTALA